MQLPLPRSLTPSKVASFKDCALAFRFSAIDRLPEPPSLAACKGTLVHKVLERLFWERDAGRRTIEAALELLQAESEIFFSGEEWAQLTEMATAAAEIADNDIRTDPKTEQGTFVKDAERLVRNYFQLEDPNVVNAIGTELMLETKVGTMTLRGIIDRLDLDENGDLVVVDYKTGRAPGINFEAGKLGGVHFYAYLCEEVLGRRPVKVRLLHLREPISITAEPSSQSIRGLQIRTEAIWTAVERACEKGDFRPNPGRMCNYCAFAEFCPAQGGTLPELQQTPILA